MNENNLPRPPIDDELSEALLREWGIPDDLVPYAHWAHYTRELPQIPPQIQLPGKWSPDAQPSMTRVLAALDAGAGLSLWASDFMDLAWFKTGTQNVTSLWCRGNDRAYQSLKTVEEMLSLRSLQLPRNSLVLELSHLANLRDADVKHKSQLSVARAPQLTHLSLTMPTVPSDFQVPTNVESLSLTARSIDLARLGDISNLRSLFVEGTAFIDLSPLADAARLQDLKIMRAREITGTAALRNCAHLREVTLIDTHVIHNTSALLDLNLERFYAVGRGFDSSFANAAERKEGWWSVPRPTKPHIDKNTADFSLRETADDRVEVSFRDFSWLAERAGINDDEIDGALVELLCQHELERTHPDWMKDDVVVLDSEGDEFIAFAPNTAVADEVVAVMNKLFANRARLRRTLRSL